MRFERRLGWAAIALAFLAVPAFAQDSTVPEHLIGMVGDWRLEQEDQSLPICALTFTEDQGVGGWAIGLHEPCPPPFPAADRLVSWTVDESDGSVLILDAAQQVTLRLLEGEDGLFVTAPEQQPAFYLMLPYDEEGAGGEADGL
jgi:hypothetical protein